MHPRHAIEVPGVFCFCFVFVFFFRTILTPKASPTSPPGSPRCLPLGQYLLPPAAGKKGHAASLPLSGENKTERIGAGAFDIH